MRGMRTNAVITVQPRQSLYLVNRVLGPLYYKPQTGRLGHEHPLMFGTFFGTRCRSAIER